MRSRMDSRLGLIRLGHGFLDFDGTRNRVKNATEFRQHAIARRIGDPTPIGADKIVDHEPTRGQGRHRRLLVGMHQPTIAFDIGGEDRREAPFQLGCFHIQISIALRGCGRRKDRGIAAPASQQLFLRAVFAALPVGVGRVTMRFGRMLVGLGGLLVALSCSPFP